MQRNELRAPVADICRVRRREQHDRGRSDSCHEFQERNTLSRREADGRFVEQHQRRSSDQGSGESQATSQSRRKIADVVIAYRCELHLVQNHIYVITSLTRRGEPTQECEMLNGHAHGDGGM